jgi:histidinol dehydrogenase
MPKRAARRWPPSAGSRDDVFPPGGRRHRGGAPEGDAAIRRYTQKFGGPSLETCASARGIPRGRAALQAREIAALERAVANVTRFHEAQLSAPLSVDTMPACVANASRARSTASACTCRRAPRRCPRRRSCWPCRRASRVPRARHRELAGPRRQVHAAVLVAAELCGVDTVYKMGGAQAIAALAFGTGTVRKVDKIFGPGSAWVTAAKQIVAGDPAGASIDLPAGPSEVLVIADDSANPQFVAADLLAQAEHDVIAQVILVTTSAALAREVTAAIESQAARLSRRDIVRQSMGASRCILVADLDTALRVSNEYAPEHLIIQTREPRSLLRKVECAGSVFIGSGRPNPWATTARAPTTSCHVRLRAQLQRRLAARIPERITVQELTAEGLRGLGPTAITLAGMEGLDAHGNAVQVRLDALAKGAHEHPVARAPRNRRAQGLCARELGPGLRSAARQ